MDKTATGGSNFHISTAFQGSGLKHALFTVSCNKYFDAKSNYLNLHLASRKCVTYLMLVIKNFTTHHVFPNG